MCEIASKRIHTPSYKTN